LSIIHEHWYGITAGAAEKEGERGGGFRELKTPLSLPIDKVPNGISSKKD